MAVTLEPMTPEAYDRWLGRTTAEYAEAKVRVGTWPADEAIERYGFPAERASLREIMELLASGDAGPVDDVMRVI